MYASLTTSFVSVLNSGFVVPPRPANEIEAERTAPQGRASRTMRKSQTQAEKAATAAELVEACNEYCLERAAAAEEMRTMAQEALLSGNIHDALEACAEANNLEPLHAETFFLQAS